MSTEVLESCRKHNVGKASTKECIEVKDPDGHTFYVKSGRRNGDPIYAVALNTNNMEKTVGKCG